MNTRKMGVRHFFVVEVQTRECGWESTLPVYLIKDDAEKERDALELLATPNKHKAKYRVKKYIPEKKDKKK